MTTDNGAFSTAGLELVKREPGRHPRVLRTADERRDSAPARGAGAHRLAAGEDAGLAAAGRAAGHPEPARRRRAGAGGLRQVRRHGTTSTWPAPAALLSAQLREPAGANPRMLEDWQSNLKAAMDSTTAGSGDELVDTQEARALWDDVNLETAIAPLFNTVADAVQPLPDSVATRRGQLVSGNGEHGRSPAPRHATARQTLTAHELVAEVPWSYDLDEDAVIAMMDELRRSLLRNAPRGH